MELNLEKNSITLYGKSYKYDLLLNKLASLPGEDLYQFITNRGIALPRRMNCMALVSVINEKIKYLHSKSLSKDYFARLEYFKDFGETGYVAVFEGICNDEESFYKYRYNLINLILINHKELQLNDGEVQYLRNIKKSGVESFQDYENYISASCLEQEGTFDGVEIETLKNSLMHAATANEILMLGKKYGIEIPQHLTRDEYYDFIIYYLTKKDKLTEETNSDLANMTLAGLTTFSRRNGVPLQPTLSKEDYITYLFYYLEGCDIVTTSVTEIEAPDMYKPLEFKVDLSQIGLFGDDVAKRIISFEGDDDPEYVEKIEKIIYDANNPKEKKDETEVLAAPLRPGEKTMDDDSGDNIELEDFELELEKQEQEALEEQKKAEEEKALDDAEIMKLIEKDKEAEKEAEPEVVEEKIDISNVVKNDQYASKKLKNLKHGNRNVIILSIVISFILIVLGFVVYALVR